MFHSARLKLTAWYLLIIMLISVTFSVAMYRLLIGEVERFDRAQRLRIERRITPGGFFPPTITVINTDLIEEVQRRILLMLASINVAIFILAGGLGYFLAGRTLEPIKQMVEEQNRFITDASHELRTPLTALKSTMEVYLRDKNLTLSEAKSVMTNNIEEVNKLQSLSDSLLQLAQYQKPNGHTVFEKLSVKHIINEAIRKTEPLTINKKIVIKNEARDFEIEGNKYGLIDLIVILLDNAIKYSPPKSTVAITTTKNDDSLLLKIIDEGIGIEKKDLAHIFDRFYRADMARVKTDAAGYGLGLSIAKKIVAVHQGTISAESTKRKGTTFTIRLPVKQDKHTRVQLFS